jgi:hypothetical protein
MESFTQQNPLVMGANLGGKLFLAQILSLGGKNLY